MCSEATDGTVAAVEAAVDRLLARIEGGVDPYTLREEVVALRRAASRLDLAFAALAAHFSASEQWMDDGYVSAISWIRERCHMTGHAAASAICVGDQIDGLPRSREAVHDGEIGFAHLALLAGTAKAVCQAPGDARFEEEPLLRKAKRHLVNRFRKDCAHVRHAADARAFLAAQLDEVDARELKIMPMENGAISITGFLDAVGGATLRTALEPLAKRNGIGDLRFRERRLADALVELAEHRLDEGTCAGSGGQRPHLQVTASLETLQGLRGAAAGELELASAVSATTVQRIACDASITRVVLNGDASVLEVGRARRLPNAAQRKALRVRDGGCVWPHCDRTASWCQAHHLHHWVNGGDSNLDNLVLLCSRHHWMIHEGQWQMFRDSDHRVVALPPVQGFSWGGVRSRRWTAAA